MEVLKNDKRGGNTLVKKKRTKISVHGQGSAATMTIPHPYKHTRRKLFGKNHRLRRGGMRGTNTPLTFPSVDLNLSSGAVAEESRMAF